MGSGEFGIDPAVMLRMAKDIAEVTRAGVQVGLVIGGGNIFRGAWLAGGGMDRVTGDHMGMLATVINSLAMKDALAKLRVRVRVTSALRIDQVCDQYARHRAVAWLERGDVVIMAAGTGNPFFTTDSAASLRAIEIGADLLIKATKVNGVYSADPVKFPNAEFFPALSYDHVLAERLGVMDATAVVLCRDHNMPMRVVNINAPGALMQLMEGRDVGTLVTASGEST